ncbi:MAG: membrane protein insertase YidC, partial [Alphaproteobacteria bacterium]
MDENNRNFLLALVLSVMVLVGWQYFFVRPQMDAHRQAQNAAGQKAAGQPQQNGSGQSNIPQPGEGTGTQPAVPAALKARPALTREAALATSKRIPIDTPSLRGSIALKGGRIDDLILKQFSQTTDADSPKVVLLSPSGSPDPYFEQSGWLGGGADDMKLPNDNTVWKLEKPGERLTPQNPVVLVYNNGKGLIFRRKIS